ncbi:hypothetical protein [Kitasatospora cineracea]|uniref:Uncharacterized protein n=1 Tax=Kitasatospora cineracea TaxID=88074 RepID=A0A3N4R120_9ACTN|nr:hypothetical protein [Kitasatospora cineracea]RPE27243.1 hypothetical protein EDD38_7387 [Kitasatospora cineracea]RPE27375.1 hypothetical protein EDD38_7520 [Kitasatospora cineracea]
MTLPLHPTDGPIHDHFTLTYANYLVLPRTLLQSMPPEWQASFVQQLDELHAAFRHVPQAEAYEVVPGTEHLVGELSDADLKAAGYSVNWYGGETPPAGMAGEELDAWQAEHEVDEPVYYDRDFNEIDRETRVLLPGPDPVPHYNRGRTYIEPLQPTT